MRSVSKARAADRRREVKGYQAVSLRARGMCEAQATPLCSGRHEHTHHKLPRSASSVRDEHRHDPDRLLAVCSLCHLYIHSNPSIAYERGWLVRRG